MEKITSGAVKKKQARATKNIKMNEKQTKRGGCADMASAGECPQKTEERETKFRDRERERQQNMERTDERACGLSDIPPFRVGH